MDTTIQMEEEVFDAVRKLTGEAERRVFLDQACANNPALRARIERLLVVQASAEKIFSRCAPDMRSEVGAFASLLADGSPAEAAGAPLPAAAEIPAQASATAQQINAAIVAFTADCSKARLCRNALAVPANMANIASSQARNSE